MTDIHSPQLLGIYIFLSIDNRILLLTGSVYNDFLNWRIVVLVVS